MNKLYILCGIPLSGKSTLATELVKRFGFTRIDLDEIKFELYGTHKKDSGMIERDWNYVYEEMYKRVDAELKTGRTVIHDTGNFTKKERNEVRQIADRLGTQTITIFLDTPPDIVRERLVKNRNTNQRFDVDQKDFESTVAEMEPPSADENPILFHHNESVEEWVKDNFEEKDL